MNTANLVKKCDNKILNMPELKRVDIPPNIWKGKGCAGCMKWEALRIALKRKKKKPELERW